MPRPTRRQTRKPEKFTADLLLRIDDLFARKGWKDKVPAGMSVQERINRFGEVLERLSVDERELFLKLSEDFLWIPWTEYPSHIDRALGMIQPIHTTDREIIVSSLKSQAQDGAGQVKSGDMIAYMLPSYFRNHGHLKGRTKLRPLTSLAAFEPSKQIQYLLLLCDDFVGSGETIENALQPHLQKAFAPNVQTYILSLVIQQHGMERARRYGDIQFAYSILCGKGIADSSKLADKDAAYRVMRNIEDRLDISDNYRCGYRQSEALVSVARTPDNTFPVYWCARDTRTKKDWPAPFLRE